MSLLTLAFYVLGDEPACVSCVKIPPTANVHDLKEAIREERKPNFDHIPTSKLDIWKVALPIDDKELKRSAEALMRQETARLSVVKKLGPLFKDQDWEEEIVHILVRGEFEQLILINVLTCDLPSVPCPAVPPILNLFCYVLGNEPGHVFCVKISPAADVYDLKKAIHKEREPDLDHVPAHKLDLWKDCLPNSADFLAAVGALDLVAEGKLWPMMKLADVFSEPPLGGHVHIFIKAPSTNGGSRNGRDRVPGIVDRYQKLIRTKGKSPSAGAKPTAYMEIQTKELEAIHDGLHNPNASLVTVAPPVHIFHPVFQQFLRDANDPQVKVSRQLLIWVHALMRSGSKILEHEPSGDQDFLEKLWGILGSSITELDVDSSSADAVLMKQTSSGVQIPLLIVERKGELGEGGCDPSVQAGLSMRQIWIQKDRDKVRDKCCCPTFLIATGGPWLCILGAVLTDKTIVHRLTDMMWIGQSSTHEDLRLHRLARVMAALCRSLDSLQEFYNTISNNTRALDNHHPRFFPYPTQFLENSQKTRFYYVEALENDSRCVTYRARVRSVDSPSIVVKFVDRYGLEVHEFLARKGYAPKLRYFGPIIGNDDSLIDGDSGVSESPLGPAVAPHMMMVVMDYIAPHKWPPLDNVRKQVTEVLNELHGSGYVFGDFRQPNILFDSNGNVKFIDFDWSGRYDNSVEDGSASDNSDCIDSPLAGNNGLVRYPLALSEKLAEGIDDLVPIWPKHDWIRLDTILSGLQEEDIS